MVAAVARLEPQMAAKPPLYAAAMAEEGLRRGVELLRNARARHQIAHQDEQRQNGQLVVLHGGYEAIGGARQRRDPAAHVPKAAETDNAHRPRDRHPQEDAREQDSEADQDDIHCRRLP